MKKHNLDPIIESALKPFMPINNTDKATARPWGTNGKAIFRKGKAVLIASTAFDVNDNGNEANAKLIVRAVNDYEKDKATIEALLEACKQASAWLSYGVKSEKKIRAVELLQQAIKIAEGG